MDFELARRVHRNLMEVNGWMGETEGGATHFENGELFFAGRSPLPFLNGVMRAQPEGDAAELLARARSFFFSRGRGFVAYVWSGDPELEQAAGAAGMFPVIERYPEMVCRERLASLSADVRPVADRDTAAAYWAICDEAYPSLGLPAGLFSAAFDPDELLDASRVWACLAYDGDAPLACASAWLTDDVALLGWVAALPSARGRGLAAACTVAATNHALTRGVDLVSLQASTMGEQLYRRLGFREVFSYRLLGAMPPETV